MSLTLSFSDRMIFGSLVNTRLHSPGAVAATPPLPVASPPAPLPEHMDNDPMKTSCPSNDTLKSLTPRVGVLL